MIDIVNIQGLIRKYQSDHYYKAFNTRTKLVTMLFGIFSRCYSMTKICEGLRTLGDKLNHLVHSKAPAKSISSDGSHNHCPEFFEDLYFSLVKKYQSLLSESQTYGLTFKEVLLIDSTTIRLSSDILKGVDFNPKGDGKKRGGLKVHMLINAVQSVGRFVKIIATKVHDKNFLKSLESILHSLIVFDWAYNYYHQFALWTEQPVFFVTRLKKNAIYIQVWCPLKAQLLLTVIQKLVNKKASYIIASLVRIHLICMLNLNQLLRSNNRMFSKHNFSPPGQLLINWGRADLGLKYKCHIYGAFVTIILTNRVLSG